MFVVNDMELLERLSKFRLLGHLTDKCTIAISGIKLHDYSLMLKNTINKINAISMHYVIKENFDAWLIGRRIPQLTIGDFSSIYLTLSNPGATLVLTPEDDFLINEAEKCSASYMQFDDFFIRMIKDERVIEFYNLIKAVA